MEGRKGEGREQGKEEKWRKGSKIKIGSRGGKRNGRREAR